MIFIPVNLGRDRVVKTDDRREVSVSGRWPAIHAWFSPHAVNKGVYTDWDYLRQSREYSYKEEL